MWPWLAQIGADRAGFHRVDRVRGRWTNASWLFLVEPRGAGRCRVISRYRCATSDDLVSRLQMGPALVEPIGSTMDREMLRGIRDGAQRRPPTALAPTC